MAAATIKKEELPLDKAKPIYYISADGTVEEGHIIFKTDPVTRVDKIKDALYIIFLTTGIVSFGIAILYPFKKST